MTRRVYGYLKDKLDPSDIRFKAVRSIDDSPVFPEKVSLRDKFKELPYDQGSLGACSAHAALGIFTYEHGGGPFSRLALYYWERELEGTINEDSGAYLRDAIKILNTKGIGLEEHWPYDISKFTIEPPPIELQEGALNKITQYFSLDDGDPNDYRQCLADGYPFMIGIQIFESFESEEVSKTGVVPMPGDRERCLGGHAVAVIGYDENFRGTNKRYYEVRNSWGKDWGDHGHFWIPAEYLENNSLGTDAWTIRG